MKNYLMDSFQEYTGAKESSGYLSVFLTSTMVFLALLSLLCPASWAGTFAIGDADGSFESGADGVVWQGDVWLVTGFGPLRPTQGEQAVLLTTEPDDGPTLADADVSFLRIENVVIPAGADQFRLDYNFFTDELATSFTNDRFTVELQISDPADDIVLLEVDTFATFYPAPFTGYAGQTGFLSLIADISAFAGGSDPVTLDLRIADRGDGRGDSAVFLDNLMFTGAGEPVAKAGTEYVEADPGVPVDFDGSDSTDSDGSILEYRWDFGDGNEASGPSVTHTYPADGIYQATLTVTDDNGDTSTDTFMVAVGTINNGPAIVSAPKTSAPENTPYRYDVEADDPELAIGDVLTFSLTEAPDGMTIDPASGLIEWTPTADHPRRSPVTVQVADSFGLSATQSFYVTIDAEVYVVATDDDGRIYSARSNGDGTFAGFHFVEDTGRSTRGAAIADLDHDGDFDFVSGHAEAGTLYLYYFERQGARFAAPAFLGSFGGSAAPAGAYLMDMAAEDFNNDGQMDFAVNSYQSPSWIFLNQGPFTFGQAGFYSADFESGNDTWGGASGSTGFFRDDSTSNSGSWSMRVFATGNFSFLTIDINPANWHLFQGPTLSFAYRIPPGVPVGLLFLVRNIKNQNLGWISLGGSPKATTSSFPVAPGAVNLIDDDQWHTATVDLYGSIRAHWPEAWLITEFEWWTWGNAAAGAGFWFDDFKVTRPTLESGFEVRRLPGTGGNGRGLDAGDANGDGNMDLVRGRSDGLIYLFRGDGAGNFSKAFIDDIGINPFGVALAEFDGDGNNDLFASNGNSGNAYFYKGNGDGTFQASSYVASLDTNRNTAYAPFDFNNDGHQDVVTVNYNFRTISFYAGNGNASFSAPAKIGTTSTTALGVAAPAGRVSGQPYSDLTADTDTIDEGQEVTFDAGDSYDDGTIVSFDWDFGDGNTGSGPQVTHAYDEEGNYVPVVTVTDDEGKRDRHSRRITVKGSPPVSDPGGPYLVNESAATNGRWPLLMDGSASADEETGIVSYEWDFDDSDGIGVDAVGIAPRHVYEAPGTYTITLTVRDEVGQAASATTTATVAAGASPLAAIDGPAVVDETSASLGRWTLRVDIGGSSDDVAVAEHTIDWGDDNITTLRAIKDDFEDGDFTTNPVWTPAKGSWQVIDGRLHQTSSTNTSTWNTLQELSTIYRDFILEVDFKGVSSGGQMGIFFRGSADAGDTTNTLQLASDDDWNYWQFSDRNKVIKQGGGGWNPGIWYHLRLVVIGNTMQLYVTPEGGVETLQLEARNTSRSAGVIRLASRGQSLIYDNVRVTLAGESLQPVHIYNEAGDYPIELTTTDHAAQSTTAVLDTRVATNAPPVSDPGGPYVLTEAAAYKGTWSFVLDATGSTDDLGIQRYTIDFGDGTTYTTGVDSGKQVGYFMAGTDLYGFDVADTSAGDARLSNIVATEDGTLVEVIDLQTQKVLDSRWLNRLDEWKMTPGDGVYFKVKATKPVVALESDGSEHAAFVPSLSGSPVGHEFIFYRNAGKGFFVYAIEDAVVQFFDRSGVLRAENIMNAGTYWEPPGLSSTRYHTVSTGKIAMQTTGSGAYTTVPSATGSSVGRQFYFATYKQTSGFKSTGDFAVFAYEDGTEVEVFSLDTGQSLYTRTLNRGEFWMQNEVGTRRMRLESTGDVELWAGDTYLTSTDIEDLGDDISFTAGRNGTEFFLHNLRETTVPFGAGPAFQQDGLIIFAPNDQTVVTIDEGDIVRTLNRDEFLHLEPEDFPNGSGMHHIVASEPVVIQTLGVANGFASEGTYLGGATARHRYTAPGRYQLKLTVTDRAGQSHTTTTDVDVQANDPPLAQFGSPTVADETFARIGRWHVPFDARDSTDDFGIASYTWDFGDQKAGSGVNPTHAYTAPGTYIVTLTVTDQAGQESSASSIVKVEVTDLPVADAGGPYSVERGWPLAFDSSGSVDDVNIEQFEWDFGDGNTGRTPNPDHIYDAEGVYTVTLKVIDNALQSDTTTTTVTVATGTSPLADAGGPYTGGVGGPPVFFDGSGSSDDQGVAQYLWDFDATQDSDSDGDPANDMDAVGRRVMHVYNEPTAPGGLILDEDFSGSTLDPDVWAASGATQDELITINGNFSWGQRYIFSKDTFTRVAGQSFQGRLRQINTPHAMMWGLKNSNENYHYSQMPHAMYFDQNAAVWIFENGVSRGKKGSFARNKFHDVRIVLKDSGALYYIKAVDADAWTLLYESVPDPNAPPPGHEFTQAGRHG